MAALPGPANCAVAIARHLSSLPEANRNHTCSDDTARPLSSPARQQASPSPGPIRSRKAIHLHFPRTALRSAARLVPAATAQRRCRFSAGVGSPSQKIPQPAAKEGEKRCKPPCTVFTVLQVRLHTDSATADFAGSTAVAAVTCA
jgi:hypothetical protein